MPWNRSFERWRQAAKFRFSHEAVPCLGWSWYSPSPRVADQGWLTGHCMSPIPVIGLPQAINALACAFCFAGHAGVRHATKGCQGKARRSPIRRPSSAPRDHSEPHVERSASNHIPVWGSPAEKRPDANPDWAESILCQIVQEVLILLLRASAGYVGASVARGPVRGLSTGPSPIFCLRKSSGACSVSHRQHAYSSTVESAK